MSPGASSPLEREVREIRAELCRLAPRAADIPEMSGLNRRVAVIEDILAGAREAEQGIMERMIAFVCAATGLRPTELISNRRSRVQAHGRFAIMWAAKRLTRYSYPRIARALGGFDHSSVIHGCRRAEALRDEDPDFRALSDALIAHFAPKPKTEEADPCLPLP